MPGTDDPYVRSAVEDVLDPQEVVGVLLADGWHTCERVSIDSWAFASDGTVYHAAGAGGVCPVAFSFHDEDDRMFYALPLTSVIALRFGLRLE